MGNVNDERVSVQGGFGDRDTEICEHKKGTKRRNYVEFQLHAEKKKQHKHTRNS